jgi:hypothetical protein
MRSLIYYKEGNYDVGIDAIKMKIVDNGRIKDYHVTGNKWLMRNLVSMIEKDRYLNFFSTKFFQDNKDEFEFNRL